MSDIVTSRIFTDGEKGITATKMNDIIGSSVIQPAFYSAKPVASTVDPPDQLLVLKAAGTYAQAPFSTVISSVSSQLPSSDPEIWNVRMRSFNAFGNPNMEISQRIVVGTAQTLGTGIWPVDRLSFYKSGATTLAGTVAQIDAGLTPIVVPGTNFGITSKFARFTLTTAQAVLAAGDYLFAFQTVEGPQLRELISDVHSISLLVRTSVAGLKFGVSLRDNPSGPTRSLTHLCTIPSANTWTLITIPNLPAFPAAGTYSLNPGSGGYSFSITLGAGSNSTSPANDTWQASGAYIGAVGQDNFASKAVNSTFDVAFVQHEPGAQCSQLMDKPFSQNYDECLRYYQKSYDYGVAIGTITNIGMRTFMSRTTTAANGSAVFHKPMAKLPTITLYDHNNGAAGSVMDAGAIHHTGAVASYIGTTDFSDLSFTTATTALMPVWCHYTADTGW